MPGTASGCLASWSAAACRREDLDTHETAADVLAWEWVAIPGFGGVHLSLNVFPERAFGQVQVVLF
jgi:hypothetical protein